MGWVGQLVSVSLAGVLEAVSAAFSMMSLGVLSTMFGWRSCSLQLSLDLLLDNTYTVMKTINVYSAFRIYTRM